MLRIKELRKQRNITLQRLADFLHTATSTISQYENGKREASFDTVLKLADFFNVTTDYLLGKDVERNISYADLGASHVRIPVYGTIPAGIPIEMIGDSYIEDYEDIDTALLKGGNTFFALKVKGDSMMPKFEDGDVLILKQQDDCENGEFCAVSINCTECTFKKVLKKSNGITLMPLNPEFDPLFFTNKEVADLPITILGVVKEVRRSY